ncbi:MAG: ATP-binding protein [Candidatus Cloacimonetes bacterium]|nr:ATP-binding protein [Candidatus Cloacimonadota bacterium]
MSSFYDVSVGKVTESSPSKVVIEISSQKKFEDYKYSLQVGKYLKVANGERTFVIVSVQNVKSEPEKKYMPEGDSKFLITAQPVGTLIDEDKFYRGTTTLPTPTEEVFLVSDELLEMIFSSGANYNFPLGTLAQSNEITLKINPNNFFSKHIAVVGSTGSGKSCTVAKILQKALGIENGAYVNSEGQNNCHIIIFDLHSEYKSAFELDDSDFNLNLLRDSNLILPYWLMNADELETMFIDANDLTAHDQRAQFRNAVILNKERHNPSVRDVTYDTPIYFNINEVRNYMDNLNNEVIGKLDWENQPKLEDGTLVMDRKKIYFEKGHIFAHTSENEATKAVPGPFHGEFDKFILNLDTKLQDKRLKFLFDPQKRDGTPYYSEDFEDIIKQFLGYKNSANITIVDLSGIPFEVLNITVSLVSRLVFDFCFQISKLKHFRDLLNDVPVLIVCEEAHNYAPRNDEPRYTASKKSLEKIVKEGRKYGLSLMVVSQRPSEVSETIFAQCNNFISLRLTNVDDQNYIRNLMSDVSSNIADVLPNLAPGEFMITGDAVLMPCVARVSKPNPEPQSQSVNFYDEWKQDWKNIDFQDIIKHWRKEQ